MLFGAKERVAIYVDGSNTYNKLKSFGLPEEDKKEMIKECSTQHLFAKEDLTPFQYLKETS